MIGEIIFGAGIATMLAGSVLKGIGKEKREAEYDEEEDDEDDDE